MKAIGVERRKIFYSSNAEKPARACRGAGFRVKERVLVLAEESDYSLVHLGCLAEDRHTRLL
jgi:hypothetical protein